MSKNQHSGNNFTPKVVPPTPPYDGADKLRHRSSGGPRPYVRDRDARGAMPARPIQLMFGVMVVSYCGLMAYAFLRSGVAGIEVMLIVLAVLGVAALVVGNKIVRDRSTALHAKQHRAAEIADNADHAAKRAEYDLTEMPLLLDDIGVVAYKDSLHPRIVRTGGAPSDSTHIRPFVVLTPRSRHEAGRAVVTFSLLDEHGTVRYTSRAGYRLQHKQNFVAPNIWLELAGESLPSEKGAKWSLHVNLNDQTPLAIHNFGWYEPVEVQFSSEGEIDVHTLGLMKQHLALADDEPVSLDDLLAEQKKNP